MQHPVPPASFEGRCRGPVEGSRLPQLVAWCSASRTAKVGRLPLTGKGRTPDERKRWYERGTLCRLLTARPACPRTWRWRWRNMGWGTAAHWMRMHATTVLRQPLNAEPSTPDAPLWPRTGSRAAVAAAEWPAASFWYPFSPDCPLKSDSAPHRTTRRAVRPACSTARGRFQQPPAAIWQSGTMDANVAESLYAIKAISAHPRCRLTRPEVNTRLSR